MSHTQPEVGTRLTASLSDPDRESSVSWQWYRGDYSRALPTEAAPISEYGNCLISGARSSSYTPKGVS